MSLEPTRAEAESQVVVVEDQESVLKKPFKAEEHLFIE
jgi:hypothetical protein